MGKRSCRCYGAGRGDRLVRSRRVASRPHSTPLRLGEGELTDPFGEEVRGVARLEFLETLDRLAPEVTADLVERLRTFLNLLTERREPDEPSRNAQAIPPELVEFLNDWHRQRVSTYGDAPDEVYVYLLPDGSAV